MKGFRFELKVAGEEFSVNIFSPLRIFSLSISPAGNYLNLLGLKKKMEGKGGDLQERFETLFSFLSEIIKTRPVAFNKVETELKGGFQDPFLTGMAFGACEFLSPFWRIKNSLSFEEFNPSIKITGEMEISLLKTLKIMYNFHTRRR